ncbi:hypothetical protein MTO96_029492 [Rhipicephalus appendiculatus]
MRRISRAFEIQSLVVAPSQRRFPLCSRSAARRGAYFRREMRERRDDDADLSSSHTLIPAQMTSSLRSHFTAPLTQRRMSPGHFLSQQQRTPVQSETVTFCARIPDDATYAFRAAINGMTGWHA